MTEACANFEIGRNQLWGTASSSLGLTLQSEVKCSVYPWTAATLTFNPKADCVPLFPHYPSHVCDDRNVLLVSFQESLGCDVTYLLAVEALDVLRPS